jgi:crossover junction endodeoxyribonuclease RuvC
MIRVLGIDPGSRTTGYGVVEMRGNRLVHVAHGAIAGGREAVLARRLGIIYRGLQEVLTAYRPAEVSIESIFHARNAQSALKLGHARGVALLAAELDDVPVVEYTPMQVKSAVVGYGKAEKVQVQQMVRRLLALETIAGADASDALAVAICHLQSRRTAVVYGNAGMGAR